MHKSQVFFYLILAFLIGVFAASFVNFSEEIILVLLISAVGLIAFCGYHKTYSAKGLLIGAILISAVFGIVRFNSFNLANSVLGQFADLQAGGKGVPVVLKGYVDEEPDLNGTKSQFIFKAKELIVPGPPSPEGFGRASRKFAVDERTLIKTDAYPKRQFGDQLSIAGSLETPQNFKDFDYVQYLKNKNIRTIVSFPKINNNAITLDLGDQLKIPLYKNLFAVKDLFENAVSHSLPEPYGAYINGILLGSRQDIPQSIKDSFNRTSTTHILAISGYNITIIADGLLAVLVLAMRRRRAFWVSVGAIFLFTILTGASASVVRAAIMGLLLLFANGYGRLYDARNSILLAAAAMVFLNPFVMVFDVGFQLSFLAVLGLVYIYPILESKFKKLPELGQLKKTLLMTMAAQVFVFPLLVYYFQQLSLVSLPANILVLPLMPLTMLFGFLTGIGGMVFGPLGKAIGLFAWGLGLYQLEVIKWFGSLSFAAVNISIRWFTLLGVYIILILIFLKIRKDAHVKE